MGEESGYVRFEQQEDAQKALAAAGEGDLVVKDCIMCVELVTGMSSICCPFISMDLSLD